MNDDDGLWKNFDVNMEAVQVAFFSVYIMIRVRSEVRLETTGPTELYNICQTGTVHL